MAITMLVSAGTPVPTTGNDDWQKAMAQLTALKTIMSGNQMHLTEWTNTTTVPKIAKGSYIQHLGAIYVVDAEDYMIAGTLPSTGNYYLKLEANGDTLTARWTGLISGYVWNAVNNGLYNGTSQVLPYQIYKAGSGETTVYIKRKIINPFANNNFSLVDYLGHLSVAGGFSVNGALEVISDATVGGVMSCASVDTGHGVNELYPMNQGVETNDSPQFEGVTLRNGRGQKRLTHQYFFTGGYHYVAYMELGEVRIVSLSEWAVASAGNIAIDTIYLPSGETPTNALFHVVGDYNLRNEYDPWTVITHCSPGSSLNGPNYIVPFGTQPFTLFERSANVASGGVEGIVTNLTLIITRVF